MNRFKQPEPSEVEYNVFYKCLLCDNNKFENFGKFGYPPDQYLVPPCKFPEIKQGGTIGIKLVRKPCSRRVLMDPPTTSGGGGVLGGKMFDLSKLSLT